MPIFWIDATYKAQDYGMNISEILECNNWQKYWNKNESTTNDEFVFIVILKY